MIILDQFVQGSPEWYAIRKGRPTASEFSNIMTPKKGEYAAAAGTYMDRLLAELLGWEQTFKGTPDTERGNLLEKEAIRWLQFSENLKGRDVAFCLSDCQRYGASPDWLVDDGSPVEVKAPDLHTFSGWWRDYRATGTIPDQHKCQCHGEMIVTGADRCIFIAYPDHEALPKLKIEVRRDAFTEKLQGFVNRFCDELDKHRKDILGEEADFYQPQLIAA